MQKQRKKEALFVLTRVHGHTKQENLVSAYLELKEIEDDIVPNLPPRIILKEMFKLKYRYYHSQGPQFLRSLKLTIPRLCVMIIIYFFSIVLEQSIL